MKCRICKTEMLVDSVVERETDSVAEFHYKCPNRQCSNYGYKEKTVLPEKSTVPETAR
jgi:hypothetical protein